MTDSDKTYGGLSAKRAFKNENPIYSNGCMWDKLDTIGLFSQRFSIWQLLITMIPLMIIIFIVCIIVCVLTFGWANPIGFLFV